MKKVLLALLAFPGVALAHTKWFAYEKLQPYVTNEPTALYLSVWGMIAAAIVSVGIYFERMHLFQLEWLKPRAGHAFIRAASVFSMVAGTFLMIAGFSGYLFSPNLTVEAGIPHWVLYAEIIIGLAFLLGVAARVAAIFLGAIWLLGFAYVGVIEMIEDIWILSTAAFVLIMGNDYFSLVSFRILGKYVQHLKSYALPLLRLGTGATLFTLGFSEKILHPEYGINFLAQHDWNFMHLLGVEGFSDYLFTLSAGSVEALIGLVFILGIVTRLNAIVIAIFFSIPLFILGPIELTGHTPHFAAVVILLLFGAGAHFKIGKAR